MTEVLENKGAMTGGGANASFRRPRVTIGMPVYNGERFLAVALDSLLAQTFADFELVISDNASTDGTEAICRAYAARDGRVRYYRNEVNLGAAANYNRLVDLARGEYFRWAAHDDLAAPTHLERCVEVLDRLPAVSLCYPRTAIIDEDGRVLKNLVDGFDLRSASPSARFRAFLRISRGWMNPAFGLIRLSVLRQTSVIGSYPSSDMLLVAELALRGEFYEVPEPLFLRREHPQMSVKANQSFQARNLWFNTGYRGGAQLTRWRWLAEYMRAIWRAPIGPAEKIRCMPPMLNWLKRTRRELWADLAGLVSARLQLARRQEVRR